jgi:hypothetical protein
MDLLSRLRSAPSVERYFGARAAEQTPHRLVQRLALDVPQGDVDGGHGMLRDAGLTARG